MEQLPPQLSDATGSGSKKIYHAGTLTYTKFGLAMLLVYLFWGDFCYTVMEAVTGPILLLKYQALNASNAEVGFLLTTLPTGVYSTLNPIISFRSDRFRSRWGRRIPFIVGSLPFLIIFLVCLAFGDQIGAWAHTHLGSWMAGLSANQALIYSYAVLLVLFTFFNTFVTSTFWYLFNDVVPEHLLARFMSWFRAVGLVATSLYNLFIFPYSSTHSTQIFLGAAVLYLVGFTLMCWNVREGEYPPPPPYESGQKGAIAGLWTYLKGTHSFAHYWYLWLTTFIGGIGGGGGAFALFYSLSIGLDQNHIGWINFWMNLAVAFFTLFSGWFADRYHPIRVVLIGGAIGTFLCTPIQLMWLYWHPSTTVVFWTSLSLNLILFAPSQALGGMWDPPMIMRMFPRTQYGQFCSMNAVWRSLGGMVGASLMGLYLDKVGQHVGHTQAYWYMPLWSLFFAIPAYYLLILFYRSWKKLGGDEAYVAPSLAAAMPVPATVMSGPPGVGN